MTTSTHPVLPLAVLSLTLVLMTPGCGDTDSGGGAREGADPSAADVAEEFQEAGSAAGEFVSDSWERFQATMDERLADADERLDALAARAEELDEDARASLNARLEDLRSQRRAIAEDLEDARDTAGRAWRDIAAGLQDAWRDLDRSVSVAAARFDRPPADAGAGDDDGND